MRTLFLSFLLVAGCTQQPAEPLRCPQADAAATWTGDGVRSCSDGALSLALSAPQPLAADGQALVRVSVAVGRDFGLVSVPVNLTVSNGTFLASGTTTLDVLTGAEGWVSTVVRVGTTPGPLVVSGEVRAQVGALDAGTGQAKNLVFVELPGAPVRSLRLQAASAKVTIGGTTTLTVLGAYDEELRVAATGATVDVCTDGGLRATPALVQLGDGGLGTTTLAAALSATPGLTEVRVCPATERCGPSTVCRATTLELEAARKPIVRTLVSVPQDAIVSAQSVTVNLAGYASADFLEVASEKAVLGVCVTGGAARDAWLQLDTSGRATTTVTAGAPGLLRIAACPWGLDCTAAMLDERCGVVERTIGPAPDAVNALALALSAPLRLDRASTLTVAAYADARRLVPSKPGVSLRLCFDDLHVDAPTALFTSADGRAQATVVARSPPDGGAADAGWPWGPVVLTACPYEVPCAAPTSVCEALDAGLPLP